MIDVIVIGGGAGGLTAAAVAAAEGLKVLLVDKAPALGGTTAISGGMVWAPANALSNGDTEEQARAYLAHTVSGDHNAPAREAFLTRAAEAVAYLDRHTDVHLQPVRVYPDYYPDLPGATLGGRVLEPVPFDASVLGKHFSLLKPPLPEFTLFGGMMVARGDIPHFRAVFRSVGSTVKVAGLVLRYLRQRLSFPRGTSLVLGNALVARFVLTLLRRNVEIRLNARVAGLIRDGNTVRGAVIDGQSVPARAVVLATGGFAHDPELRGMLLPEAPGSVSATDPGNTGEGIRLGLANGGHLGPVGDGGAFWVPVSRFTRPDGSSGLYPHTVTDRGKPGVIAVNAAGDRFVNEAVSYHEFVRAMLRDPAARRGVHLICDKTALWKYGIGAVRPMCLSLEPWKRGGYLREAASIPALAEAIGINPSALTRTVEGWNGYAVSGEDPAFGKGGNAYQRHMGDAAHRPNPCVAPIDAAPFYAVELRAGDLGTSTGLDTDADARVLDAAGDAIGGLWAVGNDMNSIMNGAYPGPGITIGPALTFGYLAAKSIAAEIAKGNDHAGT